MSSPKPDGGAALMPRHWKALQWFAEHGPAHLFGANEPSSAVRRVLIDAGCIESKRSVRTAGPFGFAEYEITETGRALLTARQSS